MKKLLLVLLILMSSYACSTLDQLEPVELACGFCQALDESGICEMMPGVVVKDVPECTEGQKLYISNFKDVFENGAEMQLECK